MELREDFLSTLRGVSRLEFILNLEYELSMMERVLYRDSRKTSYLASVVPFCNELRIVINNQLRSDLLGRGGGYPDEALEEVLAEKSQRAGMLDLWSEVVERAIVALR